MISLAIMLTLSIFAFFFYALVCAAVHINVADSFLISLAAALALHKYAHWHPAFCLLVFLFCWVFVAALQQFKIPYWLISLPFSAVYAYKLGKMIYDSTHNDLIWGWVSGSLAFLLCLALHMSHSPASRNDTINSIPPNLTGIDMQTGQRVFIRDVYRRK